MRLIALTAALSFVLAAAYQPRSARAAMDGLVTREEALRIVETPLEKTIGHAEADRVQRVAVANALLEHCRLDWGRLFQALTAYHRHHRGRSETEMSRITVWHGAWQGQALDMLRRERPTCDEGMRRAALGGAARQLQALAPGGGDT
jgi:hypothetical protein